MAKDSPNSHICLRWNNHGPLFEKYLSSLYMNESLSDCGILCEKKIIPCHQLILSTCSEYFDNLFQLLNSSKYPIIVLKDIHFNDLDNILTFIYNGEVIIPRDMVPDFMNAASSFKIKGLTDNITSKSTPYRTCVSKDALIQLPRDTSSPLNDTNSLSSNIIRDMLENEPLEKEADNNFSRFVKIEEDLPDANVIEDQLNQNSSYENINSEALLDNEQEVETEAMNNDKEYQYNIETVFGNSEEEDNMADDFQGFDESISKYNETVVACSQDSSTSQIQENSLTDCENSSLTSTTDVSTISDKISKSLNTFLVPERKAGKAASEKLSSRSKSVSKLTKNSSTSKLISKTSTKKYPLRITRRINKILKPATVRNVTLKKNSLYRNNQKISINNEDSIPMKVNSGRNLLKCDYCNFSTTKQIVFKAHLLNHPGSDRFECPYCNYKSGNRSLVLHHIKCHKAKESYACSKCPYRSQNKQNLYLHMRIHSNIKRFSCNKCNYKCTFKHRLKLHMVKHSDEKPFQCPLCEYAAKTGSRLRNHRVAMHTDEKTTRLYSCTQCNYKAKIRQTLKTHMRIHSGERPFACPHCDHRSQYLQHLNQHMYTHTDFRPFQCSFCLFQTVQHSVLKKHVVSKHPNEVPV